MTDSEDRWKYINIDADFLGNGEHVLLRTGWEMFCEIMGTIDKNSVSKFYKKGFGL